MIFKKKMRLPYYSLLVLIFISVNNHVLSQVLYNKRNPMKTTVNVDEPKEYEVGGIRVSNIKYLDAKNLKDMSGISVGDNIKVPGDKIQTAIKNYWNQELFSDVEIRADSIVNNLVYLEIYLQEHLRLNKYKITGIKKSEKKDLLEKLKLKQGKEINENVLNNIRLTIHDFFLEKGYSQTTIDIKQVEASENNYVNLNININKNERIKIKNIIIKGNETFSDFRLERKMKDTKEKNIWNLFNSSKYIKEDFEDDQDKLISFYNKNGYRDARIDSISIKNISDKFLQITITIDEGNKYYFGEIDWVGNTKYSAEILDKMLGIQKGDVYDQELLEKRLFQAEDAITSLYLDNGYLFSNIEPVVGGINNDSINYKMRIFEGKQARINKIIIIGNTKTNEHVIRRELRTMPGELFSKSDIIRSIRELSQLGFFDPEKIQPNPIPHQKDGTVDIEYDLTEKSSDQLEISGGWGAGMLVGTIGVRFSNFSSKDLFNFKKWRPIPTGDGETLSLRAQSNGSYYQSYNISFVKPWFGGKRPNDFSISLYHTIRNNSYRFSKKADKWLKISGASVGLGRRLRWPDDYFNMYNELSYQQYNLKDWSGYFLFANGTSNNISFTTRFSRNSIDQPIFPRRGSSFAVSLQLTPPYSLLNTGIDNYATRNDQDKYRWIEYHKWKFNSKWYFTIVGNLVLYTRGEFGYLGHYNNDIGPSPFEGFDVGGDGLTGYNIYGRETIALRGYENSSITPRINGNKSGNVYDKFTMELRFPFVLKTAATVYGLAFLEGGNAWYDIKSFSPYDIKRSAGVGLRAFLPMFGLLGVDWGYGFDAIPGQPNANKGNFHFTIGREF